MKYTLINTEDNSNCGDELLTKNAKLILNNVFGGQCECDVRYAQNFEKLIDKINSTDICFISTISYCDYDIDSCYDLIKKIKVPIIALSSTLAVQRYELPKRVTLNSKQREIINIVNKYSGVVPVRDVFTKYVLENNGIKNVKVVGDLGLFNFGNPVQKMKQPAEIRKILITAGHQEIYNGQLIDVLSYLSKKFPGAEFTYSTHTLPEKAFDFSKTKLKHLNIKTADTSVSCDKLEFYKDFDLHIGYRLHGHIKSLSVGVPSILIAEDSRGLGQQYTLNNVGTFTAFDFDLKHKFLKVASKNQLYKNLFERIFSIKYYYTQEYKNYLLVTILGIKINKKLGKIGEIKKSKNLIDEIDKHIDMSIYTNWIFYTTIPETINSLYNNSFIPFLQNSINNVKKKLHT